MRINKKFLSEGMFYSFLLIQLIPALSLKYFLTVDGPAHLYNSFVIKELILGNSGLIKSMYSFNDVLTPNWTGHFIMSVLSLFCNGFLTEKIFILCYLIFLPISFRYLIKSISPSVDDLSYLIFPFTYSFLFLNGFFNFCISFIFLFFTLGYWFRNRTRFKAKQFIIFSLLLTITYFSHVMVFGFLCLSILTLMMGVCIKDSGSIKDFATLLLKQSFILFICTLPSLLLMIHFFISTKMESQYSILPFNELVSWILNVKPLVLFGYQDEFSISHCFIYIYLALFCYSIFARIKGIFDNTPESSVFFASLKRSFDITDVILLFSLCILVLFFVVPDGASAGMMSNRLCFIFFIFLILWLALQPLKRWFYLLIVFSILSLNFLLLNQHYPRFRDLSKTAGEMFETSKFIKNESIVLPLNWTPNWMLVHTQNYLGVDKSVIMLGNCEPLYKWFPLIWNDRGYPNLLLGERSEIKNVWWKSNKQGTIKKIDYVMIFSLPDWLNKTEYDELRAELLRSYNLVFRSDNACINLYELKGNKL